MNIIWTPTISFEVEMSDDTFGAGLYHDDPDEKITVVSWDEQGEDPVPLFAVETKDDGIRAARVLVDRFGGRSKWTTVPLQRVTSYDEVTNILPEADDE